MLKPSASNKVKCATDQVTGANAKANSSPDKAELQAWVANQELATSDLRRHNIKIVEIQEEEEEGKPTEFVSRLIPQLLWEEHFPHLVKWIEHTILLSRNWQRPKATHNPGAYPSF
ncbi:hypothetical protein QQF64_009408 [Cirrhinus molitorella]|uniref:Uncharacterized protein n=1 Tax=Cirrhinus molitorella TaxID=172907 RepID=A0ABR3M134_9TELE